MTKKRALVTGGSGAIGAVICQRLAADGYSVIVHAHRHAQSAEQVAEKIAANGGTGRAGRSAPFSLCIVISRVGLYGKQRPYEAISLSGRPLASA